MNETIKVSKLGRGRPKGTGKPDQDTLQRIADLLLDNPRMRHTTAIKRIIGTANPSAIRRLQVKWKEHGSRLCGEAQQRRQRRRTPAAASASVLDHTGMARAVIDGGTFSAASQMRPFLDEMNIKAAAHHAKLGAALAAVERTMSPTLSIAAEINRTMSPVLDAHAAIERMMEPVTVAAREARAGIEQMMAPVSAASDVRAAIQHISTPPAIAPEMRATVEQMTSPALIVDTRSLMPPTLSDTTLQTQRFDRGDVPPVLAPTGRPRLRTSECNIRRVRHLVEAKQLQRLGRTVIDGIRPRKLGSHWTLRWRG